MSIQWTTVGELNPFENKYRIGLGLGDLSFHQTSELGWLRQNMGLDRTGIGEIKGVVPLERSRFDPAERGACLRYRYQRCYLTIFLLERVIEYLSSRLEGAQSFLSSR